MGSIPGGGSGSGGSSSSSSGSCMALLSSESCVSVGTELSVDVAALESPYSEGLITMEQSSGPAGDQPVLSHSSGVF